MRVISGKAKGRQLKAPPTFNTRPMTDRLKTSLFDTLVPYGIEGARVLDLYAGSGSLGIEMLSRGAEWVDFVEQSPIVCRTIQDNLKSTGLGDKAHVYKMYVARFLSMKRSRGHEEGHNEGEEGIGGSSDGEYDIIILDPPYADPSIQDTLENIASSSLLVEDGFLVIGHAIQVKLADEYSEGRLQRSKHKVMGGSAFSIYERVSEASGR